MYMFIIYIRSHFGSSHGSSRRKFCASAGGTRYRSRAVELSALPLHHFQEEHLGPTPSHCASWVLLLHHLQKQFDNAGSLRQHAVSLQHAIPLAFRLPGEEATGQWRGIPRFLQLRGYSIWGPYRTRSSNGKLWIRRHCLVSTSLLTIPLYHRLLWQRMTRIGILSRRWQRPWTSHKQ